MPATEPSSGGVVADPGSVTHTAVPPDAAGRSGTADGVAATPAPPVAGAVTPLPPEPPIPDASFWGDKEAARARRTATRPVPAVTARPADAEGAAPSPTVSGADGGGGYEARKVRRIIRHVSPWSVFKVSLLFNICLWAILLVAGVLLWNVAQRTGVITNIEKFYARSTGEEFHEIDGRGVFRAAAMIGAVLALAGTGLLVLMSVLFNLISDLVGGIRVSVIELERRRPRRR